MIRPLVRFNYDLSRTGTREAPSPGSPVPILVDNDTLLVGGPNWDTFQVYRRIPAGQGGAQ